MQTKRNRPFEVRPLRIEDLELEPTCFANASDGFARMGKAAHYAQISLPGRANPVYWFRNITPEGQRWAGITELGSGPLRYQTGIHGDDIAQDRDETVPYHEVSELDPTGSEVKTSGDDGKTPAMATPDDAVSQSISSERTGALRAFEMLTPHPYCLLRFEETEDGGIRGHAVEGPEGAILDLTIEPFPYAVISHAHTAQPAPYFQVNTVVRGTFHGEPVLGLGGFDRTFVRRQIRPEESNIASPGQTSIHAAACERPVPGDKTVADQVERDYAATYRCTCALYSGIRKDGRKECVYALITGENGHGIGMYYIDGEEPIATDEVRLDAVFRPLPYMDDGTVVYIDAVWHIGPKTIHFHGRWGAKSFSYAPKLDKHGQSQCFGTWYEGDTPYRHIVSHAFNENTGEAYAERFRAMGFTVLDA